MTKQLISIVTPCFNEEENVEACAAEVARVMTEELSGYEYEHIFCDNASTDKTLGLLRDMASRDAHIKVVVNSRNVGPLRNIANGIRHVSGDFAIPMIPADLQDPPAMVPVMMQLMKPDVDVVYGIRRNRKETLPLRVSRSLYYLALKAGGGVAPPSHAGEFLLARRHIIDAVVATGAGQSYVRGLVAQTAPRSRTLEYDWGIREHGVSRNSLNSLIDQALTGLVTTVKTPMRWALLLGMVFAIIGIGIALVNVVIFLSGAATANPGIPTLIVGVFFLGGLQLFFLGMIGEFVVSIHSKVYPEPAVVERELINF